MVASCVSRNGSHAPTRLSVDIDPNVAGVAVQKAVKDHAEMAIEPFDVGEKRGVIGLVLFASEVDFPPSDECSGLAACKLRERI